MSVIEDLRYAIESSNWEEEERFKQAESLRKDVEGILKNGSRRPRTLVYASLPLYPIIALAEFISWPISRMNPIDLSTNISLKTEVDRTEVKIHSFSGNIRGSDITVDVQNLGRLRLGPLAALTADISPDDDIYHEKWWRQPLVRSYRSASLDELKAFSALVQKVNSPVLN